MSKPLDNRLFLRVGILDYEIIGLLDSGATCSVFGKGCYELVNKLGLVIFEVDSPVCTADKTAHKVQDAAYVPVTFNGKTVVLKILLVPHFEKQLILGMDFWDQFDIKLEMEWQEDVFEFELGGSKLNGEMEKELKEVVDSFLAVTEGTLTRTHILKHKIDTGDNEPVKQRYYPTSPYVQEKVNAELDRMLKLGVIEKSDSPWSSPMVVVKKPNGNIRLCLDSRKLNERTKKDAYPLPYISGILGKFVGTKYLSSIDLKDAFWQIPLEETAKEKTAFTIPTRGLYQFTVMPFGLHNAPQTQCRLMDRVLGADLQPHVFVYLDDIVVATNTFEEHIKMLKEVSKRLRDANLGINLEKSKFCVPQIKYLGYIVDRNGIHTDPGKIEAIVSYPAPKCNKDVRRFIGLASWYRRFISNFSSIVSPITELLKGKIKKFEWSKEADAAFLKLKSALVSAPVLANPDFSRPFVIQTDASDIGIGAVLVQEYEEGEKVISYMSQKLTSTQRKYNVAERECLAVLTALDKFRPYIEGVHFTVITDNSSLLWLKTLKDPMGRLGRWALRMQSYDFELRHRKGKNNVVPDALSRAVETVELIKEKEGQMNKTWYDQLKENVQTKPEIHADYQIKDGELYRYIFRKMPNTGSWVLVVPPERKNQILHENHDDMAHMGIHKTLSRLYRLYFWKNIQKDAIEYVQNCKVCRASKPKNVNTTPTMGKQKVANFPWQFISMDFMGPFVSSKKGNTMLFVITDWFSKFTLLFPMRKANSTNICKIVEEQVFHIFGVPEIVLSDNGKQFISNNFKALLVKYECKQWFNALYHPQINPTERVNKVIVSAIRAYLNSIRDHRLWDENISRIGWAIRSSYHEATKFTPNFANFGREIINSGKEYKYPTYYEHQDQNELVENQAASLKQVREAIKLNLKKAYEKYAKYYNLRARPVSFNEGEIVWRENFAQSDASKKFVAKLAPTYIECRVKKCTGNNTYDLEDMNGKFLGNFSAKHILKGSKTNDI